MKDTIELAYGAKIKPDGRHGFLVTFRDIKNAFTGAATYEEAIFNAQEVLDLMLLDRLGKNENIPLPSSLRSSEVSISASPDVAASRVITYFANDYTSLNGRCCKKNGGALSKLSENGIWKNLTMKSLKKAASALGSIVEIRLRKLRKAPA